MGERRVKRKHPFKFQTWYGHTDAWYKKCQLCTAMSRSKNGKTPKLCSSHGQRWTLYSKLKKYCTEICHVFFSIFTLCPLSFNFVFIIQFKTISHGIRQKKMEMKRKKKGVAFCRFSLYLEDRVVDCTGWTIEEELTVG